MTNFKIDNMKKQQLLEPIKVEHKASDDRQLHFDFKLD